MRLKTNTKLILVALAVIAVVSFLGNITDGFQIHLKDATLRDRNESNLLTGKYGWKDDVYNNGDGYKLTAGKDGTVTINGEYTGSSASATVVLEKVTLSAGTYTISGAPNGGNQTYLIRANTGSGSYVADFGAEGGTFTLTTSTEVTIELVLFGDFEFNNVKIRPVLVDGSEAGEFYAK